MYHGFLRDQFGNYTSFAPAGSGTTTFLGTRSSAINASGEIAGSYSDNASVTHAFVRDASGNITSFDVKKSSVTSAVSLNDSGEVLGQFAGTQTTGFVRNATGKITTISVSVANTGTGTTSINSAGHLTGWYSDSSGATHGFKF